MTDTDVRVMRAQEAAFRAIQLGIVDKSLAEKFGNELVKLALLGITYKWEVDPTPYPKEHSTHNAF